MRPRAYQGQTTRGLIAQRCRKAVCLLRGRLDRNGPASELRRRATLTTNGREPEKERTRIIVKACGCQSVRESGDATGRRGLMPNAAGTTLAVLMKLNGLIQYRIKPE